MTTAPAASHHALSRSLSLAVAIAAAGAGAALAAQHPLSPPLALAGLAVGSLVFALWPLAWLVALPALLPWLGLAPWTGWITFEEFDLLLLAIAAGGHARLALRPPPGPGSEPAPLAMLLLLAWTAAVALAAWRGVADAGGWSFDLYQGYRGPTNVLRMAKPTLALWLLLPLWRRGQAAAGALATRRLALGLTLGLLGVSLACLWERWVYTGLADFSSDYRTVGSFWEMHVGGAALDASLALLLPFGLRGLATARGRGGLALSALASLLGAYAALTTFSRILLLALPAGALLLMPLQRAASAVGPAPVRATAEPATPRQAGLTALLCLAVAAAAAWMFPGSGWRGMVALLCSAGLLLALAPRVSALRRREWLAAVALALAAAPLLGAVVVLLPKGPYLALGFAVFAGVLALAMGGGTAVALGAAAFVGTLGCTAAVAWSWGGQAALEQTWPVLAMFAAALALAARQAAPVWPAHARWQAGTLLALLAAGAAVGTFSGGNFMKERIGNLDADEQGRFAHWHATLMRIPDDTALWLGTGLGRYADRYAIDAQGKDRPGDLRLGRDEQGRPMMRMVAGTHMQGWGAMLRLSQRIEQPHGRLTVTLLMRSTVAQHLHAEVCAKHLLYGSDCRYAELTTTAGPDWQKVTLPLRGGDDASTDAPWNPLEGVVFSLATETSAQPLELRELHLVDGRGAELLANADFGRSGARWFFSSDKHHLPWHAKNILVHLVFEQGLLGLGVFALLWLTAMARVTLGHARRHPMAPALAAALLGVAVVGMVDSLLDIPRITTLLLLLAGVALTLPARDGASPPPAGPLR